MAGIQKGSESLNHCHFYGISSLHFNEAVPSALIVVIFIFEASQLE